MATRDEVRQELIRSRGFIRGAETQLSKAIAALDALDEPVVVDPPVTEPDPVDPTPEPEPDPIPDPEPPVEPEPGDPWALDSQVPGGMALRAWNPHTDLPGSGWGVANRASGESVSLVTDPTAPAVMLNGQTYTDPSVVRQNWAGIADGQSPDFLFCGAGGGVRRVHVASALRISSQMLPRNEVKLLEWMLNGSSAWLGIYPPGNMKNQTSVPQLVLVSRASGDTHTMPVNGGQHIPLDRYAKVAYTLDIDAARGSLWIDDVLVSEGPLNFGRSSAFEEFQQGAVWGGGNGNAAPAGAEVRYAATAIWTG